MAPLDRRCRITRIAALCVLAIAIARLAAAEEPSASPRPNIVFILADDLGYGDLGCYGRDDIRTPALDRLARDGVRFTSAYANGPECTPTRAAFLTGRYPHRVGGLECAIGTGNVGRYDDAIRLRASDDLGLPTSETSIATMLKSAGYRTGLFGKWHLGYEPKFAPHLHGFDETFYCVGGGMDYFHYLDTVAGYNLFRDGKPIHADGYFTDLVTAESIGFIERSVEREPRRPFFLYVPYTCPHSPFQGPGDRDANPLPLDLPLWNQSEAPPDVYIAMIERMDHGIGRILGALDRLELRDDTCFIFLSDNGGTRSARNAPLRGFKGSTFEGGIRVPEILRWPEVVPAGIESTQACITFDFTASIARIAGVEPPSERPFDGIDIIRHVSKRLDDIDRTLFWRKPRGDTIWRGVRDGSLKYVSQQQGAKLVEHLFDLEADPAEQVDLLERRTDDAARLRGMFRRWEEEVRRERR